MPAPLALAALVAAVCPGPPAAVAFTARLADRTGGPPDTRFDPAVRALCHSPAHRALVFSHKGGVWAWRLPLEAHAPARLVGAGGDVTALAADAAGRVFAAGFFPGVKAFDGATGREVASAPGPASTVVSLVVRGDELVVHRIRDGVAFHDAATLRERRRVLAGGTVPRAVVTPDGAAVCYSEPGARFGDESARLLDAGGGWRREANLGAGEPAAVSPDGRFIALTGSRPFGDEVTVVERLTGAEAFGVLTPGPGRFDRGRPPTDPFAVGPPPAAFVGRLGTTACFRAAPAVVGVVPLHHPAAARYLKVATAASVRCFAVVDTWTVAVGTGDGRVALIRVAPGPLVRPVPKADRGPAYTPTAELLAALFDDRGGPSGGYHAVPALLARPDKTIPALAAAVPTPAPIPMGAAPTPADVRASRAIHVLGLLADRPAARAALERLAAGPAGHRTTEDARRTLALVTPSRAASPPAGR